MFRTLTTTAVVALLAGSAFADGVNYARLSYDFTRYENDDNGFELDSNLLQGGIEYELGQFLLTGDAFNQSFSIDDLDETTFALAVSGAYVVSPQALVGVGVLYSEFEEDFGNIASFDDDATGFEIFGQYVDPQFGVALNVTQFDSDEDNVTTSFYGEASVAEEVTLGTIITTQSEFDGTAYSLIAEYDAGPIFGRAVYSDDTEDDLELGIFLLRGTYEITPQIRAAANYELFTGDDLPDAYTFSVGGGYQFVEGLWADALVGFLDGDDISGDPRALQIALTYETGDRKRLDRRMEQSRIDDLQVGSLLALDF